MSLYLYHDRRESGSERGFLCQTFFSYKRPCFTRETNCLNFQTPFGVRGSRLQRACRCAGSRARAACWPLLAIARRHRSASTGLSRAAGIVSAGRDLQLVCSSATSSVQLWRRTSREADRRSGPLSARRRALRPSPNPELGASAPSGSATQYSSPADMCCAALHPQHTTARS